MPVRPGPELREAALLTGVAAALLVDGAVGSGDGLSVAGVLAVGLAVAVLAARRRAPLVAVPAMCLAIAACLATLSPGDTVFLPGGIAAFSGALHGDRRRSLLLAAVLVPVAAGLVVGFSSDLEVGKILFNAGVVAGAVVLGDSVRARADARRADEERRAQEDRERELDARRRVAEERLRIARDVHDVVAHSIVAINVQAGVAAHLLHSRPENAEAALKEIKRVSGAALQDLRTTLGVLRDEDEADVPPLRPVDPLGRLDGLAEPLRAAGVDVRVRIDGPQGDVPTAVATAAYRIVQEALTNVLRHADARAAGVDVAVGRDAVEVVVTDDGGDAEGAGAAGPTDGAGAGLRGMRERAAAVGGTAEAGRADGAWTVRARLPLRAVAEGTS
ncbi:sensor histidine kinase [Patulibacter minatonensis]|uniref:sensor histidine kinase n=1 Tax=Patulibacter minatonensis TaxID=298163 RepID=UPI0004B0536E|nr:histidine kinase [Patulibacter minatonensis]